MSAGWLAASSAGPTRSPSPSSSGSGTAPRNALCAGHSARTCRGGATAPARRAVPRCAMGIPRRPGAAEFRLRASGRRPVATRLRHQHRHRGHRRAFPTPTASAPPRSTDTPPICPECPMFRRCPPRPAHSSTGAGWDRRPRPPARPPGSAFLTVDSTAPLFSDSSEAQLDRLHAVPGPAGRMST